LTATYTRIIRIDSFDFTTIINIKGTDRDCQITSVNPGDNAYASILHYHSGSVSIATESVTPPSMGDAFDDSVYSQVPIAGADVSVTNENSMHSEIEIIMQPDDYLLNIHALFFKHFTGGSDSVYVLTFDTPVVKTNFDKITISVVLDLTGVRV